MASQNQPQGSSFRSLGIINASGTLCHLSSVIQAIFHHGPFVYWLRRHHYKYRSIESNQGQRSTAVELRASGCTGTGCDKCCKLDDCIVCDLSYVLQSYWHVELEDRLKLRGKVAVELEKKLYDESGTEDLRLEQQDATETFQTLGQRFSLSEWTGENFGRMFGVTDSIMTKKCPNPRCDNSTFNNNIGGFGYPCQIDQVIRGRNEFTDVPLEKMLDKAWGIDIREVRCQDETCWFSRGRKYGPIEAPYFLFPDAEQLPGMFCANVLRYEHSRGGPQEGFKMSWPVTIPSQLDLGDYVYPRATKETKYDLYAVVSHHGDMKGGHYKTVLRGSDDHWLEMDDERISLLASRTNFDALFEDSNGYPPAAEAAWSLAGWTPCMAFYRRHGDETLNT